MNESKTGGRCGNGGLRDRPAGAARRGTSPRATWMLLPAVAVLAASCAAPGATGGPRRPTTTPAPATTGTTSADPVEEVVPTTSTTHPPAAPPKKAPTPKGAAPAGSTETAPVTLPTLPKLAEGATGRAVAFLQRSLMALHYWVDTEDGTFDDSTEQAVYALQKAAGIGRDGVVGPHTWEALFRRTEPLPRPATGDVIEVDLGRDLLMFVHDGTLTWTLNTSTGGGYTYYDQGSLNVAVTPTGVYHTYRVIDGLDVDTLGELWRPRFFTGGFAIHGDGYVPPFPASHGCVRVSNEAIDWIWAENLDPIGREVWLYG